MTECKTKIEVALNNDRDMIAVSGFWVYFKTIIKII